MSVTSKILHWLHAVVDALNVGVIAVFDRPESQSSFYRFLFNDASRLEDVSMTVNLKLTPWTSCHFHSVSASYPL